MNFKSIIIYSCSILLLQACGVISKGKFDQGSQKLILPLQYGIQNDGTLISHSNLDAWLTDCKNSKSPVYFPAGKYLLPPDFEFDFGKADLSINGDGPEKTILTTFNGSSTNFAIPEKIDLTKKRSVADGVYQVDLTADSINGDFTVVKNIPLDSYLQITNGTIQLITLEEIKAMGYITELDTRSADPGIDGLYVVAKHPPHEYGGGFTHLQLPYPGQPLYLQGTVLERKNGWWSRYYSSVAFISEGNFSVKNISFSNFRPYLFLPASKTRNQKLKTRDHFIIENCRFEHCARILATMTYAGIMESENWYKAGSYYPMNHEMRFKRFMIKNNAFSYIHESIVWGVPPALTYSITSNNIHDCYTMLNCFYLFPQFNRSLPEERKSSFSITGNTFLRIRALNPGAENTVHLIRTSSKGMISQNTFIDCTGIQLYIGGKTNITRNVIKTFMTDVPATQTRPPVILVKIAKDELISISNNDIAMGMMGSLVANESRASFAVTHNKLIGAGTRYISRLTDRGNPLDIYRTYIVKDLAIFHGLAGLGNYDPSINLFNTVYYNKRSSRWEHLKTNPPMYLFSEVDHFNAIRQYVIFSGNEIETNYLTRIQKKSTTRFQSVLFENNQIQDCNGLHAGNEHNVINEYNFSGNVVKNGHLNMTSLGELSASIRSLNITGNTFFTDFTGSSSFAASESLIFRKNTFLKNEEFDFGNSDSYPLFNLSTVPASAFQLTLTGRPGQRMIIQENKFIAAMTRGGILNIVNPDRVLITENSFNLNLPSWQAATINSRVAIHFKATDTVSNIRVKSNSYTTETGKENFLISFDDSISTIKKFMVSGNTISSNLPAVIKLVSANNKSFTIYSVE